MNRRPHILIVDDDPHVRRTVAEAARELGLEPVEAQDGVRALAYTRTQVPDLVVTDLRMPRLGGERLVQMLRATPHMADVPILVLTADDTREAKVRLLEAGVDGFLSKPWDPDELRAQLRALCRRSEVVSRLATVTRERDHARMTLEERNRELERLTFGLVASLERANTLNDSDTGNHSRRVCAYARLLAEASGCSNEFSDDLFRYAGLHDVGKVGIKDAILKKPGKLTREEFEEMKHHTLIGAELLHSAGLPAMVTNIAKHHHECWDGSGYPHGLTRERIPLEARIVAVVDVFDALLSRRCYKPAFSYADACKDLRSSAGAHLDPDLVETFLALEEQIQGVVASHADGETRAEAWR